MKDFRCKLDQSKLTELKQILEALNNLPQRFHTKKKRDKSETDVEDDDDEYPNEDKKEERAQEFDDQHLTRFQIEDLGFKVKDQLSKKDTEKYLYVNLTEHIDIFKSNYMFPFENVNCPFMNVVGQTVEFAGHKSKKFEYNTDEKVFKLSLHFKAKLNENFENTNYEFPFEWQFLNMQFPHQFSCRTKIVSIPSDLANPN